MNEKEIREIRKRFNVEKNNITNIYGCYVNEAGKIVATVDEFVSSMPLEASERVLGVIKRALSGTLGKNLVNIEFSAHQVMEGEEHKLLYTLRESELRDEAALQTFYERVIQSAKIEGNYLILLVRDVYAVPFRGGDGFAQMDASDEEFSYILCCVCPVKLTPPELSFHIGENCFRAASMGYAVSAPELGFMFPAFDDRGTNIYGALYYTKNPADNHQEFVDAIFRVEPPMPAAVQKETFQLLLGETLKEECSIDVVHGVNEQLGQLLDAHKETREPEPLTMTKQDMGVVLRECGVGEEHITEFATSFDAHFGDGAALPAANIVERKQMVIKTPDAVIKVETESGDRINTRVIEGVKYILIPADGEVEVNGVRVNVG